MHCEAWEACMEQRDVRGVGSGIRIVQILVNDWTVATGTYPIFGVWLGSRPRR